MNHYLKDLEVLRNNMLSNPLYLSLLLSLTFIITTLLVLTLHFRFNLTVEAYKPSYVGSPRVVRDEISFILPLAYSAEVVDGVITITEKGSDEALMTAESDTADTHSDICSSNRAGFKLNEYSTVKFTDNQYYICGDDSVDVKGYSWIINHFEGADLDVMYFILNSAEPA